MIALLPYALAGGAAYGAYALSKKLGKHPAAVSVPVTGTLAKVSQPIAVKPAAVVPASDLPPGSKDYKPTTPPPVASRAGVLSLQPIVITPGGSATMAVQTAQDVQNALNTLGQQPPLAVDGNVGPATTAAIKAFQSAHGLSVDGLAGPATKSALAAALAALATKASDTASHPAVQAAAAGVAHPALTALDTMTAVKHALNLLGTSPALVEDESVDPATYAAVKAFQTGHGLDANGGADPATKAAILVAIAARAPVASPLAGTNVTGM